MKELEKVMKALANRRRLAILKFLKKNEKANVHMIAEEIDLSFKATSKHLRVLASADILDRNQIGLEIWYEFSVTLPAGVRPILSLL